MENKLTESLFCLLLDEGRTSELNLEILNTVSEDDLIFWSSDSREHYYDITTRRVTAIADKIFGALWV